MFTSVKRQQARANARNLPPTDTLLHGSAVGVQNEAEMAKLRELGFDGATGPGVKGQRSTPTG